MATSPSRRAAAATTARAEPDKMAQFVVTFVILGGLTAVLWPHLDATSKLMVGVFGVIAALSIMNGTWMADTRQLRRQSRDERADAYAYAYNWFKGKVGSHRMPPKSEGAKPPPNKAAAPPAGASPAKTAAPSRPSPSRGGGKEKVS